MRIRILVLLLSFCFSFAWSQNLTPKQFREDFNFLWQTIRDDYCYFDKKETDWDKVREVYGPQFDTVQSRHSFVLLLERVFNELYDHHASLSTNTRESQRLVPSGTDLWAEFVKGKPVITEVRRDFGAWNCGLRPGMEILAVNDTPIQKALQSFLPLCLKKESPEATNYALRVLLAGKAIDDRKIKIKDGVTSKDYYPDRPMNLLLEHTYSVDIESRIYEGNIGYIRINNQLGNNGLIPLFDSVLNTLHDTRALVLDLRETPGGGNTTVARALLGSFIRKEGFYQKHELTAEERAYGIRRSWVETVTPRSRVYQKPIAILCNHWTGSVGEGIVIGFDALQRGCIAGTPMAGLNGAIYSYRMPNSGIGFSFPVEKLFHVNGTPRENFRPPILVDLQKAKTDADAVLTEALKRLKSGRCIPLRTSE